MSFDMNPLDDEIDREEYERWETLQEGECSCECWRCTSGGHCVRCNWNKERSVSEQSQNELEPII